MKKRFSSKEAQQVTSATTKERRAAWRDAENASREDTSRPSFIHILPVGITYACLLTAAFRASHS